MAEMRIQKAVSTRAAVAAFHLAMIQLLESAGVVGDSGDQDLNDVTVNVNLRVCRIDIAQISADGLHIGQWLCGFSIDPNNLPEFGTRLDVPGATERTH